jgi:hypothetical protein
MIFKKDNSGSVSLGQTDLESQNKALQEKLEELQAKIDNATLNAKVLEYGSKLKVEDTAKNLIEKGSIESFESALVALVDAHLENAEDLADSFEETASKSVGISSTKTDSSFDEEIKTYGDAINYIMNRDDIDAEKAQEKAAREFKDILAKQYK